MNILQIVPHYIPAYEFGGPLAVAHGLGKALAGEGHAVTVCTTDRARERSRLDVETGEPVTIDGIRVIYHPVRFLESWGFAPTFVFRAWREASAADIAVVHSHFQFLSTFGAVACRLRDVPYAVFPHSSLRLAAIQHKSRRRKLAYLRLLEWKNLREAQFLAFNAEEELKDSICPGEGIVLPNAVDFDMLERSPPRGFFRDSHPRTRDKLLLLFLGRLDVEQKGLDLLMKAIARLDDRSSMCLVLAGPDEEGGRSRLQAQARRLGVDESILFTGMLEGDEKLGALQDADIFLLPSRVEGGSIALLEALLFGTPVLVTENVGLSGEIDEFRCGVVTRVDVDSIASGITHLVSPSVRSSYQGRGTELVRSRHTWDRVAKTLLAEFEGRCT